MDPSCPAVPLAAFALDPAVVHLNHGSFGACPRVVLVAQDAARARLEAAPMRFFVREWQGAVDSARAPLAAHVGADPAQLVFVTNATTGVATVLGSIDWRAGDEIVVTDHAYNACANAAGRIAETRGARVVTVPIPVPLDGSDAPEAAILAAVGPRCRLVLVDHITSHTGLRFDVAALATELDRRGVDLLVDGAHAPGQIALDLATLGATYYTANCHKWLCAPKGVGFLWARADRAPALRPLVTSHGESAWFGPPNRFHARFDWTGTYDPSATLAVPAALDAIPALAGADWPAVHARNHALALAWREDLAARLGSDDIAPAGRIGAMIAVPITLPAGAEHLGFERDLLDAGWEVPIIWFGGGAFVRLSAHVYNQADQAGQLAAELAARGVTGRRLG